MNELEINRKKYCLPILLLCLFLIVFPKGGFKAGAVPLTFGYMLLALFFLISLVGILLRKERVIRSNIIIVIFSTIPFQILILLNFYSNGVSNLGMAISMIASFIFLPWAMIMVFEYYLNKMSYSYLFKMIKWSVFIIAIYGIFLFLYFQATGKYFEIPYLTVNIDDAGTLTDKYNMRGDISKLISTYNNGNIYGISLLIILPLYSYLENSKVKKIIVNLSIVLTLSRTVWVGLFIYYLLKIVYINKSKIKAVLFGIVGISGFFFAITKLLDLMQMNSSFILDSSMGGRSEQFQLLKSIGLFSYVPFDGIGEITYVFILEFFGVIGIIFFTLAMCTPIILHFMKFNSFSKSEYKKSLVSGLIIYLLISCSDGAVQYIPVMVFYWFVVGLLLSGNPDFKTTVVNHDTINKVKSKSRKRLLPKIVWSK
ncbi:hypothetical protein NOM01_04575 [Sporolactobacillus sp. STSJ-5]|uniref:hypothetical protein n=1 Tax=Sporolactobacillus sp. STSJ-5 TaxID=2965076 RepID=UPI002105CFF1|nr:hypothetical protein [Sporolactobacillus sp. STSJ-5]MCQ2009269.1 hypothetical protein [Sporolactobacillus sp. STSJ-5]